MNAGPMTVTRKFDPTVYGLHKNQQHLIMILACLLMPTFLIGMFTVSIDLTMKLAAGQAILEGLFFMWVGSSPSSLYHFECTCRLFKAIYKGEDYIEKHGINGMQKARSLTHIKKIHFGKYIEYFFTKARPHNFGTMLKLDSFQPDDLEQFALNIERMFVGNPDKTLIKTFLHVRPDLVDYAAPIKEELKKNRIPQIVRESMFEFQLMCEESDSKSFENHMLILLDYTPSLEKAIGKLDIITNTVQEILTSMGIGSEILETEDEILGMFYGHITYGIHQGA